MSPFCLQGLSQHLRQIMTLTYRALNGNTPVKIKNLLNERDTSQNLRGQHLLHVPRVHTTNYGLHSFRYSACKFWISLLNSLRTAPTTNAFKLAANQIEFNRYCCSFCKEKFLYLIFVHNRLVLFLSFTSSKILA